MQLSKKQVKALLEVISSDSSRPVLCTASISVYNDRAYLVATDGYKLSALSLPETFKQHEKKVIIRGELVKWYKLAATKDYFTDETLEPLLEESPGNYPEWSHLLPEQTKKLVKPITVVALDPKYWVIMNELSGEDLTLEHYDSMLFQAVTRNDDIYIVMGKKV